MFVIATRLVLVLLWFALLPIVAGQTSTALDRATRSAQAGRLPEGNSYLNSRTWRPRAEATLLNQQSEYVRLMIDRHNASSALRDRYRMIRGQLLYINDQVRNGDANRASLYRDVQSVRQALRQIEIDLNLPASEHFRG